MTDTLSPPQENESPREQVNDIKAFIEAQVADVEGYTQGEDELGPGNETYNRESPMQRAANGSAVFFARQDVIKDGEGERVSNCNIHIMPNDKSMPGWSIYFYDNGLLDISYDSTDPEKDGTDYADITLEEALQDPKHKKAFEDTNKFLHETLAEPKKEYKHCAKPTGISIEQLDEADAQKAIASVEANIGKEMFEYFLPTHSFTTDAGDSWLSSTPTTINGRLYCAFYRQDGDQVQPFVVYTSKSQAAWRVLPRLGNGDSNPLWHDKGLSGEDGLNLPLALQQSLWEFSQTTSVKDPEIEKVGGGNYLLSTDLVALTESSYDAGLAGDAQERIAIDPKSHDWQPDKSTVIAQYSFKNSQHGDITARVLASNNHKIHYLVLQKEGDYLPWIASAELVDSNMLDSFILDKQPQASLSICAPRVEYGHRANGGPRRGYEDNEQQLLRNPLIRSLLE